MTGATEFKDVLKGIPGITSCDVLLSRMSTVGIGGVPIFFCMPRSVDELIELTALFRAREIPFLITGNMSNILFPDEGVDRAVIQIKLGAFSSVAREGRTLVCGGGVLLSRAIKEALSYGLSGLEGLVGIPASCGGACFMNASGVSAISDVVESAEVVDLYTGRVSTFCKERFLFGYRKSSLRLDRDVVTSVRFGLKPKDKSEILSALRDNMFAKMKAQPISEKSLGCVFKNPADDVPSAGELLDRTGLKGRSEGGAAYSKEHANYIVNRGNAKCEDFIKLVRLGKKKVKENFGLELEEEIRILQNDA